MAPALVTLRKTAEISFDLIRHMIRATRCIMPTYVVPKPR